jgi:hypothetical protein
VHSSLVDASNLSLLVLLRLTNCPCTDPALWYHGGTQGLARYYSRFIALQIKASLLGTPLPIYLKTP